MINPDVRLSIADIAGQHGISRNYMMKVINQLAATGLIDTARGCGGGFTLAKKPEDITISQVVRQTELTLQPVDCDNCMLKTGCGLTPVLGEAVEAFLAVLDRKTLAVTLKDSEIDLASLQIVQALLVYKNQSGIDRLIVAVERPIMGWKRTPRPHHSSAT